MTAQSLGDPRGPRAAAWVSTGVLAVVLLTGSTALLALQALVFGLGTHGASPYALAFSRFVRPHLGEPDRLEPAAPTRFAELVGLVLVTVGTLAALAGLPNVATAATAAALAAAFLSAAFGLCLGSEVYLLVRRALAGEGAPCTTSRREGATA